MSFQVTITECYGDRRTFISQHRTDEEGHAIGLAVKKAYGNNKFLCIDNGLTIRGSSTRYGQVGHYINKQRNQISTDTGRVRVEAESI